MQDKWLPKTRQADANGMRKTKPDQTSHTMSTTTTTTTTTYPGPGSSLPNKPRSSSRTEHRIASKSEHGNAARTEPISLSRNEYRDEEFSRSGPRNISAGSQRQRLQKEHPRKSSIQRKPVHEIPSLQAMAQHGYPRSSRDDLQQSPPFPESGRLRQVSPQETYASSLDPQDSSGNLARNTTMGRQSWPDMDVPSSQNQAREETPLYQHSYHQTHIPSNGYPRSSDSHMGAELPNHPPGNGMAHGTLQPKNYPASSPNHAQPSPRNFYQQDHVTQPFQSDVSSFPSQKQTQTDSRRHARKASADKPLPRNPEVDALYKPSKSPKVLPRSAMKGAREPEIHQESGLLRREPDLPNLRHEANRRSDAEAPPAQDVVERAKSNTVDTEIIEHMAPGKSPIIHHLLFPHLPLLPL